MMMVMILSFHYHYPYFQFQKCLPKLQRHGGKFRRCKWCRWPSGSQRWQLWRCLLDPTHTNRTPSTSKHSNGWVSPTHKNTTINVCENPFQPATSFTTKFVQSTPARTVTTMEHSQSGSGGNLPPTARSGWSIVNVKRQNCLALLQHSRI